jgi:phosphotransferase system enzyme I (PtsI)
MRITKGIAVSPGVSIAPAFIFVDDSAEIPQYHITVADVQSELARFREASLLAKKEIETLRDHAKKEAGEEQAAIFDAHLMMLDDPELLEQIEHSLNDNLFNVESAILSFETEMVDKLSSSADPLIQERVSDVHDVVRRILGHLLKKERISLSDIETEIILVAKDLLPSDMVGMSRSMVRGIVTESGGRTSHAAILARAFEIPAVLGVGPNFVDQVKPGQPVYIDGEKGIVAVDPDDVFMQREKAARLARIQREKENRELREVLAQTKDGTRISLVANIEMPDEVTNAVEYGAEGIGLFRSEFLFLGGHVPGEEEQCKEYTRVVQAMQGKTVTIRTLDIGGDKVLPELGAVGEKNPLLGWRAIRFCLEKTELFKTQLRAILRASVHGKVKIMFPMISTIDELIRAQGLLAEAKWECKAHGHSIDSNIETGIMIEVPSAAICADVLSRSCDFFSIGTNDLSQYTLAVDRGNQKVAYLNEPYSISVLRLIRMTIGYGEHAHIDVSLCGEMAADPASAVLLVGMGLRTLSMSASSIPAIKRALRSVTIEEASALAHQALSMHTSSQISALLTSKLSL